MAGATGSRPVTHVVTCFLRHNSRILLLNRSQKVRTFKGKWAAVSGYVEADADAQSRIEIQEEGGLSPVDVSLVKRGVPFEVNDAQNATLWIVHPYLYEVITDNSVRIDWEHDELRWILPSELGGFETVPGLDVALAAVLNV